MLLNSSQALTFLGYSYDILILGGGTAGLTLANRLSGVSPPLSIGVLEAGPSASNDPRVYIPGNYGASAGTELDWNYTTTPQEALDGKQIAWAAGKLLGGGSGLNYMVFDVGHSAEYDTWGALAGDKEEWSGKEILKNVRKVEKVHAPSRQSQVGFTPIPPFNPAFHGHDGAINTGFPYWQPEYAKTYLPTLEAAGLKTNPDPLSGDNVGGTTSLTSTSEKAERSYAGNAYDFSNKDNVKILTGVTIGRVLIKKGVATGAEFYDSVTKKKYTVGIKKGGEIIVSGGSVQSPKILELSGIGDKKVLEAAGIDVVVDNPRVGANLQDHIYTALTWELALPEPTRDWIFTNKTFAAEQLALYNLNRSGVLTTTPSVLAFAPLSSIFSSSGLTNLTKLYSTPRARQIHALPSGDSPRVPQVELLFVPYKLSSSFTAVPGKNYFTMLAALLHPLSHGSIHIASTSPFDKPTINPRLYSEPLDKAVMIAAARYAAKVAGTKPLAGKLASRLLPVKTGELSDDEWWSHIKSEIGSVKHYIGTCAMGPKGEGVVDSKLKVWGVKGLRVVDASTFPSHVSAHTQASVYATAEKAAEMVIEELKGKGYGSV